MSAVKILSLFLILFASACAQTKRAEPLNAEELGKPINPGAGITLRYIANEGVLIAAGDKQVLIDGLHREYRPAYLFPPPELQTVLENARPPYDKINLLLVSHIHLDHFHPESVGLHLKGNARTLFASSPQAADEIIKGFTEHAKVKAQIRPVTWEPGKSSQIDHEGIRVRFLGLRHGGDRWKHIQNLGHVIEVGGKKFLHIGDADMNAENFSAFTLAQERIDVAFIPYWFLTSEPGRKLVREQFAPKLIIAVHIPPGETESVAAQLKKDIPEARAFTRLLEELSL